MEPQGPRPIPTRAQVGQSNARETPSSKRLHVAAERFRRDGDRGTRAVDRMVGEDRDAAPPLAHIAMLLSDRAISLMSCLRLCATEAGFGDSSD